MERKNPKQLRLTKDIGEAAESVHREYQVATGQHNLTFVEFGNLVFTEGLHTMNILIDRKRNSMGKRKIRRAK